VDQLFKGTSASTYANVRYVKGKLLLYAADNQHAPIINSVVFQSVASMLYEKDGTYELGLNMQSIATSQSKTFKEVKRIVWNETLPAQTNLLIHSASSPDGVSYTGYSAPYRKNANRLRLKTGFNTHTVVLGPFNEANQQQYWRNNAMIRCVSQSYLPLNSKNTGITFTFSKTKTNRTDPQNLLQEMKNAENPVGSPLVFSPQPYFLTIELTRKSTELSPVVDIVDIQQEMIYEEEVRFDTHNISSVDNNHTGIVELTPISAASHHLPNDSSQVSINQDSMRASSIIYEIRDKTNRPNDVMLYFKSEELLQSKTNRSASATDIVKGKVLRQFEKVNDKSGIIEHFQYNSGTVQYLKPVHSQMESVFTPTLSTNIYYRYYLENGWPEELVITRPNQTLNEIANLYSTTEEKLRTRNPNLLYGVDGTLASGQSIYIPSPTVNPNITIKFENNSLITEKSTHNANVKLARNEEVVDRTSENIFVETVSLPEKDYVDWVSDEYIYHGVINLNDIRSPYGRTQFGSDTNHPAERLYKTKLGDTWESIAAAYNVTLEDLLFYNRYVGDLSVGIQLTIPPNFLVPDIASGVVIENPNIYELQILEGSVKTSSATLASSVIPIDWAGKRKPLTVTLKESAPITASITRGTEAHGMDPLPVWNVNRIISIARPTSGNYQPWNEDIQAGDYKLTDSYVDWSPNEVGSQEPAAGDVYTVTYTVNEVDRVDIYLDSTFTERIRADQIWRSSDVKVIDGVCSPTQDAKILLPKMDTFEGYHPKYQKMEYIVEDNDVWVFTKWIRENEDHYLLATMNGQDPEKFWHPMVETGFYHIGNEDYYLYGETLITDITEKEAPTVQNVYYPNNQTIVLLPEKTNYVKDSVFQKTTYKPSFILDSTTTNL
jgi:hypothetical protein